MGGNFPAGKREGRNGQKEPLILNTRGLGLEPGRENPPGFGSGRDIGSGRDG